MTSRRGFTLLETVMSLTAGSTLMVLAVGLVQKTMQLSHAAQEDCSCRQSVMLLCEQLRRDVHLAERVEKQENGRMTLHRIDSSQVVYESIGNRVSREYLAEGERRHREDWEVATRSRGKLEILDSPRRVVLSIMRDSGLQGADARLERRIEATVGRSIIPPLAVEEQL